MFNNIGNKIKVLAKILCWVEIALFILLGVSMIVFGFLEDIIGKYYITVGFISIIVGPILSWISNFVLYGFGELVENSNK